MAPQVDALYFFLVALTAFFTLLISGLVVYFAIRYRRRSADEIGAPIHGNLTLEITWTVIPFDHRPGHLRVEREAVLHDGPPARRHARRLRGRQAVDVEVPAPGRPARDQRAARAGGPAGEADDDVAGRDPQLLHPGFPREGGRAARAATRTCGSRPPSRALPPVLRRVLRHGALGDDRLGRGDGARRVPGSGWPGAPGRARWPRRARSCSRTSPASPATRRIRPAAARRCIGLFGKAVKLDDGRTVEADEAYLRESIVNPRAKIVTGFQPIMPTFQGLVSEEELLQLIEYIKSLKADAGERDGEEVGRWTPPPRRTPTT